MTEQIATANPENEEAAQDQPEVPPAFAVVDARTANWVVRKITGADDEEERIKEFAAKEITRVRREREFFLFRFGRALEAWAQSEISKLKGRRKTVRLPAGSLSFRSQPPKLVLDDERAVIIWAKKNLPNAVEMVEKLSKTALNEHFEQTGELPPSGVHVEPSREAFYIR